MDYINRQLNKLERFSGHKYFSYILIFSILLISSKIRYIEDYEVLKTIKNLYIVMINLILILIIFKKNEVKKYFKGINKLFIFTVLFAFISVIWSQSAIDTGKNSIFLMCTALPAIYIGVNYKKEEIFEILIKWFLLITTINLILVIFRLGNIYDTQEVRYDSVIRGIFTHRNILGLYMTLSIGFSMWFLLYKSDGGKLKYIFIGESVIAAILLYMSKSMTSIVLLIGMMILLIITRYKRINKIIVYGFVPLLLLSVYVIIYQPQWYVNLLRLLGRNPSLTDRDVIWRGAIAGIQAKPWLGYGYSGYWTNNIYSVNFVATFYGGLPNHAHNGYLDILLDFGIIGASFIITALGITMAKIKKLNSIKDVKNIEYVNFILTFIVFIGFYNLIEGPIVRHLSTTYVFFIIFFNIIENSYNSIIMEGK